MEGFANLGDTRGAIESYRRGGALYEELVKAAPGSEKYRAGYATMLHYLGMMQNVTVDAKGAIENGRKAVSIFESLIVADPNNAFARRSLGVSYNGLGICLLQSGDVEEALENHRKSLSVVETTVADNPNGENRRDLVMRLEFLGNAQLKANDFDSALTSYRKALSDYQEDSEESADPLSYLYAGFGKAQAEKGELKDAAASLRRAIRYAEQAAQKSPSNAKVRTHLAENYLEGGRILKRYAEVTKNENDRRETCAFLQKSLDVWNSLRQEGVLSTINAARPEEAAKEAASSCR